MISTVDLGEFDSQTREIYEQLLPYLKPTVDADNYCLFNTNVHQPEVKDIAISPFSSISSDISSLDVGDECQASRYYVHH